MAARNKPHDKQIYVSTADLPLWKQFKTDFPKQTSFIIMKLVKLYLSGALYTQNGEQIKDLEFRSDTEEVA